MLGKSGAHTQFGPSTDRGARGAPVTAGRDEFDLIEALRARFDAVGGPLGPGDLGIGDDAAAVTLPGSGRVVLATDLVVEGVHVDLRISTPEDVGWKALMVAVSDIGAMGCAPSHALVSVAAPAGFPVERLGDGVAQAAAAAGCRVIGGDLSTSSLLVVSVTAVGPADDADTALLTRGGARPGDHLLVTGPLGASAAGLRMLDDKGSAPVPEASASAHRRPVARIREGVAARSAGAAACIDVSDGLVADVSHLAEASQVGLDLVVGAGLVAAGATRDEALGGGEDYELVIATPDPEALFAAFARAGLRVPLAIGTCVERSGGQRLDGGDLPSGGGAMGSEAARPEQGAAGAARSQGSVPSMTIETAETVRRRAAGWRPVSGGAQPGKERIGRLVTLPDRMQDVQTLRRLGEPSTTARTFWTFGSQRRLVRRWE